MGTEPTACRALLPVYRAGRRNCRAPLQRAAEPDRCTERRAAHRREGDQRGDGCAEKYKSAKASLDKRIIDNEEWYKLGHWKQYGNRVMEGKRAPSTGWLFNSIANKHADAMDNYPEPNVLPRAQDDEETAKLLSEILPVLLEQEEYEQVYSDTWWRKLKQGTGVKGIFWDPGLRNGVGDISIKSMDLLMMYWEPGVEDIQDSANFFSVWRWLTTTV